MKDHHDSIVKAYKEKIPIAMGTDAGTPSTIMVRI